jgi:hypothetical protein
MQKIRVSTAAAPKGLSLPEPERAALSCHVRNMGERTALAALGLNRQTLARALSGLTLYPGSIALVRQGLARLEAETEREREAKQIADHHLRDPRPRRSDLLHVGEGLGEALEQITGRVNG